MIDVTQKYDRKEWINFLKDSFLPEDFHAEETVVPYTAKYTREVIKLGECSSKLGECPSIGLSVFEIKHQSQHDARVGLSKEAFALVRDYTFHNRALALFVPQDNTARYRFSLVEFTPVVTEQGKVKPEYSNPRRYSYLLGEGCKQHTPQKMLFDKGKVEKVEDLSSRFAVDVVTKEFYREIDVWYKKCLDDIQIDLKAAGKTLNKKIDEELKPQAVIRVITRLMFIWFMKEKGLIKELFFTREFAEQYLKNKDTFYNAVLQNLFFAVLNKKIDDRRFRNQDKKRCYDPGKNDYGILDVFRYKDFFKDDKADDFLEQTKTIPFVNGGLFVCHDYKFSGKDATVNKNNTAENYIIDGFSDNAKDRVKISDDVIFELIALFDRFAFTIEESTPTDQDIALDPELLGAVFENLIGSYNPETRENARKQTGSFYTPREIVDYMCKESLKEALKTKLPALSAQIDDLIDKDEDQLNFPDKTKLIAVITGLKVLDPACGSGAFPMGMFMLMTRTIEKLQEHKTTYKNKLDIIANCIYGVDIQNIAVEISKLRFFISLLVDYQTPDKVADFDVLPNLETKFVVANTLIGIEKDEQNELFGLEWGFKELTDIFLRFTTAKTPKEKETIKNCFNLKKEEIVNNPNFHCGSDTKDKILAWNPFNVCYCSPFFDKQIMFGIKEGFDVVIGNPPYVQLQSNQGKLAKMYENSGYESFVRTGDIYQLFYECGFKLLNESGHLCFITSNKWMRAGYGEKTRSFWGEKANAKILIDFAGQKVFESATVDVNIILVGKHQDRQSTLGCVIKEYCKNNMTDYIKRSSTRVSFPKDGQSWVILSAIEQRIKEKIEKTGKPLKNWDIKIYRGVLTGCNEAFIIDGVKRKELIAKDANSAEVIRPILRGRDIKRYGYNFADLYVVNTHNGIPNKNIPPIDIKNYPAVKEHLDKYWKKIKDRDDQGVTPYNLRSCAYINDFYSEKIIYPNMTKYMPFYLDKDGFYTNQKCFIITGTNLAYLTAFFNSNIFKICYRDNFPELQGGTRELSKIFFEEVKIPDVPDCISIDFDELVEDRQQEGDYADIRLEKALILHLELQQYEDFIMSYKI